MKKILILSDLHAPYHNVDAFRLLLKVGKFLKPDWVICNGDIADFYSISSHSKDTARKNRLKEEVVVVRSCLGALRNLGAPNNVFIEGNHEDRLTRFLKDKAEELSDVVSLNRLLGLKEMGWQHVKYGRFYTLGKITYTHDLSYSGPDIARRALRDAHHSIVVGHAHRIGYCVDGDISGRVKVGASFGWLGDVDQADYMHRLRANREWATGFGVGYLDIETGVTYLVPVVIVNNTCCVEGKLFAV